jgi:hypothetical protein
MMYHKGVPRAEAKLYNSYCLARKARYKVGLNLPDVLWLIHIGSWCPHCFGAPNRIASTRKFCELLRKAKPGLGFLEQALAVNY